MEFFGKSSEVTDEKIQSSINIQGEEEDKNAIGGTSTIEKRVEDLEKFQIELIEKFGTHVPVKAPQCGWKAQLTKPEYLCPAFLGFLFSLVLLFVILTLNKIPGLSVCFM